MKKLIIAAVFTTLALTFSAGDSHARRGKMNKGMRSHERIMKQLDLTKEQKEQLAGIRKNSTEQMKTLREKKRSAKEALHEAFEKNADEATLKGKHAEVQTLGSQLGNLRFEKMLSIRKILTPEQRTKFFETMKQRRQRRTQDGRGMRSGGMRSGGMRSDGMRSDGMRSGGMRGNNGQDDWNDRDDTDY